ncbi:uncharacterized protein LOC125319335 [Corvus hawaiiensis]|uniref:uncharacterized protein LOC125319335 n=1 Tax=Corvus hawaiiensis TaxID=134902 RepID=UPI00201A231D|nr:uncharacterized protein LOC125319335 [Corvus hawaiiensis]
MADLLAEQLTVMREVSQQLAALLEMLLRVTVAGPVPAAAPAAAPARTVALLRVATSLPSTQPSTASAATPSAGPAPIPCQLSSSALEPSEILLPDEANSNTEETPAPQQETVVVARRRQSVSRLPQNCPWTLPECKVTVRPKNSRRFWEAVRLRALEAGDWDLIEKVGMPEDAEGPVQVATVPREGVMVDQDDSEPSQGVIQAFPVQKALPNMGQPYKREVIARRVIQYLQSKVAQYGLGSPEVMQVIRVLNTDLLSPFDIKHLGQVIFQPVQFTVFESNWRRMAEKAAAQNVQLPPTDPRHGVRVDALMGANFFSNPDLQATWHPQVLEQAQRIGMGALLKSIDMAAPKTRYVKISQGQKEQFLSFVEKIAAALEKQVEDETLRQMLCKQLARDNANNECRKIIDALPRDPTLTEMVEACSKVGSGDYKSALAAVLQPIQVNSDREQRKPKVESKQKQARQKQKENKGSSHCERCDRPGHYAKYCESMYHANSQLLTSLGNMNRSVRGNCAQTQILPQGMAQTQAYSASLEAAPKDQPGWMCTPQQQSS